MKYFTIFLFLFIFGDSISKINGWHWIWTCQSNKGICQRIRSEVFNNSSPQYASQHVCRLVCGKNGALWPIPTISTELDSNLIYIHPSNIKYNLVQGTEVSKEFFKEITTIFFQNLLKECGGDCTITSQASILLYMTVLNHEIDLTPDTDESYVLEVTTKGVDTLIQITSPTLFGARHGLETLSQLIAPYSHKSSTGLAMVAKAKIYDKPVFKHIGLLLDTARNYLQMDSIKKQIDAMASCKMNVLHLHATDTQSFPIQSERIPEFTKYGAYSPHHTYTLASISCLRRYALHRGVRLLIEIDAPSHAGNGWQWGPEAGMGHLAVCVNQQPWRQSCIQPPCGQLNPANHKVYDVLRDLYKDLVDYVVRDEFHMGGDEVFINCWNTTQEITSYMAKKGWSRTEEGFFNLWSEFQSKNLQSFDEAAGNSSTSVIIWSSQLTDSENIEKYLPLKDRYIIQTWVAATNPLPMNLLDKGYRVIISTKNAWYLDHGFWGTTQYYTWRTMYNNWISRREGVLGGEACMWGEYVDKSSLDGKIWPRVAAVAERLWSDPDSDKASYGVETRFYRHRERLVSRGIAADAVAPAWCTINEGQCM